MRASAFVLVLFTAFFPARAATTVVIVDLGTLGGSSSHATAVNASGQVVGHSATVGDAETHAFSWTQAGGMIDLGTLGGSESSAEAVNASGQVVGDSATPDDADFPAFSWTRAGGMINLHSLGGTVSGAYAVNDSGQVVGDSFTPDDADFHAFSWTRAGGMIDLGTLGGFGSHATAVNASGQVVGDSATVGDASAHAVLWSTSPPQCEPLCTTTTTTTMTFSTTTLPCTSARCVLDAGLQSPVCAGEPVPRRLANKFGSAASLIEKADASPTKQANRLRRRAKKTLRQAKALALRAAKGKEPKISPDCGAALKDAADRVLAGSY